MNIYLDNCCYNRPYDDQSQLRISLEAQAKLQIQSFIKSKEVLLSASYVLLYENSKNPYELRQKTIYSFVKEYVNSYVDTSYSEEVKEIADEFIQRGIMVADAHHLACAIVARSDCFITTDDKLLRFKSERIRILDPVAFIREWEEVRNNGDK
ncbi:MAG: PIN domain-containing protein [Lachnospiraceae bacterium]|nr:PIN domain-containing protein [Lachnospiraceae bacterium]